MRPAQTHFTRARGSAPEPTPAPRAIPRKLRLVRDYELRAGTQGFEVLSVGGTPFAWFLFRDDAERFVQQCGKGQR